MSARASIFDGIKLNERQYEELISTRLNTEQIGRCNLPGRSRSNRIITAQQLDFMITFNGNCLILVA